LYYTVNADIALVEMLAAVALGNMSSLRNITVRNHISTLLYLLCALSHGASFNYVLLISQSPYSDSYAASATADSTSVGPPLQLLLTPEAAPQTDEDWRNVFDTIYGKKQPQQQSVLVQHTGGSSSNSDNAMQY
jgi:hypothetical protein